ncbi:MAG: alpha/beta hydrolase, partial [Schumannella sp.]
MARVPRGYAEHAGGQLHYRRWSPGVEHRHGDAPWVLLHHSSSDSRSLDGLGAELADRGSTVLAVDTPGFGMSDPVEPPTVAGFAGAVVQGVRSMGIQRGSVFGHHTGASIALRMAVDGGAHVDRAVLSGLMLPEPSDRERLSPALRPLPVDAAGSHLTSAWERVSRYMPAAPLDVLTREAVALLSASSPHLVYDQLLGYDSRADLARVTAPLLVVCGGDEFLAASTPAAAEFAHDGRWRIIVGAGLDMPETHAAELADAMVAFA